MLKADEICTFCRNGKGSLATYSDIAERVILSGDLYCVSSLVSAISEEVFTVFSRNLSKSMQEKNTRLCAATVGDNIFPNGATVLWYFEALLIGIIFPQFESRFKHFLLVIRIIHTSRSFLQKQHQQFFSGERYSLLIINSYLVFSFWFLLFAFFYDNVSAIRCTHIYCSIDGIQPTGCNVVCRNKLPIYL